MSDETSRSVKADVNRPCPRLGLAAAMLLLGIGLAACRDARQPVRYPPVVVMSPYQLPGVVVRGAARNWWRLAASRARYGDPLPVAVTEYCLNGTTRRGRYVRSGIIAADPRFFPLAHYVELYIGRKYAGHFLVDDTGKRIRGARIDIWTPNCREARRFGIQRGTAVLVERGAPSGPSDIRQAGAPRAP